MTRKEIETFVYSKKLVQENMPFWFYAQQRAVTSPQNATHLLRESYGISQKDCLKGYIDLVHEHFRLSVPLQSQKLVLGWIEKPKLYVIVCGNFVIDGGYIIDIPKFLKLYNQSLITEKIQIDPQKAA